MSAELIGFLSVGFAVVAVGVSLWRMMACVEDRITKNADKAHETIGRNIDEVKSGLRAVNTRLDSLTEKVSQNASGIAWIKGYLMKKEEES